MKNLRMKLKKSERFLVKNAIMTGSVFVVIIFVLSIFLCRSFLVNDDLKTLKTTQDSLNNISNLSEKSLVENYKKIGYISANKDIEMCFRKNTDKNLFFQRSVEVTKFLDTFKSFDEAILSSFVYSPYTNYIVTSDGSIPFSVYSDTKWLNFYNGLDKEETGMFFRKDSSGIYVMTFVYRAGKGKNNDGGIVVDINIEKHLKFDADLYSLMLVDKNNGIVYKNNIGEDFLKAVANSEKRQKNGKNAKNAKNEKNEKNEKIIKYKNSYYAVCMKKSDVSDFSYIIIREIQNYTRNRAFIYLGVFVIFLMLGVSAMIIAVYLASSSYKPIREIADVIENPSLEKSMENLLNDSTTKKIVDSIVMITSNNNKLRDELNERMGTLNYAQLKALQWQINPHFIFNTLNMMYYLIDDEVGSGSKAANGILSLSGIIRYSLKTEPMVVPFEEEISYAKKYISLMNARFDDSFFAEWDIDEKYYDKKIVKMCLQPVLENCFKYGSDDSVKKGYIKISAIENDGMFCLKVADNGKGMSEEKLLEIRDKLNNEIAISEIHVGLANIHKRIVLLFGEKYGVEIKSKENEGTEVILKFPDFINGEGDKIEA